MRIIAELFRLLGAVLALTVLASLPMLALLGYMLWPRSLEPATPPLLREVTAVGGWMSEGCLKSPNGTLFRPEALSPELMSRLQADFPPGSDAEQLRSAVLAQGFHMGKPCADDPSIVHATFRQTGGDLSRLPIVATIAWKAAHGRIVWTKGFVDFRGL